MCVCVFLIGLQDPGLTLVYSIYVCVCGSYSTSSMRTSSTTS